MISGNPPNQSNMSPGAGTSPNNLNIQESLSRAHAHWEAGQADQAELLAQRYDVGQQFEPHTDYFEPGTPEHAKFGAERGNRTWTFTRRLLDVLRGLSASPARKRAIDRLTSPSLSVMTHP